jgi:hypothetical protein
MKFTKLFALMVGVLLVAVLAACGGNAAPAATSAPSGGDSQAAGDPAAAAKSFFNAVYTGGDIGPLTCASAAAAAEAFKASAEASTAAFAASNATMSTDGLTFTTSNQNGNNADVTVAGKLALTAGGSTTEMDFPSTALRFVNENGGWKYCGAAA